MTPTTPTPNAELDDINKAILTGGEIYWRKVYHAYFVPLRLFISARFGPIPQDIAEELSCKTLLKLIEGTRKPQFSDKRQLVAWLYTAARTTSLDYWRSTAGKGLRSTEGVEDMDDLLVAVPEEISARTPSNTAVTTVLNELSARERLLLTMRAQGTAYKTIAEELDIAENAARTYFERAKRKFIKRYAILLESTAL